MRETGEGAGIWMDQASSALLAAEDMITGGLPAEAISSSFLAMICAARATLYDMDLEASGWEDAVQLFQREALPALGISKENQRALIIVNDLYRRVEYTHEVEADTLTAAACLNDARAFVAEIRRKIEPPG